MNQAIAREDILPGDRIRRTQIHEYTALKKHTGPEDEGETYELIERPVTLPTVPGHYVDKQDDVWRLFGGGTWLCYDSPDDEPTDFGPFTLLRPVAEVAAEIADWMDAAEWSWGKLNPVLTSAVRRQFGVTK